MKKFLTAIMLTITLMLSACQDNDANRIYVFSQPGCIHCEHAREYINRYYKNYDIKEINIREGANLNHMMKYAKKFKVTQNLGTPFIVMGENYIMGWGNKQIKDFNRYAKKYTSLTQSQK